MEDRFYNSDFFVECMNKKHGKVLELCVKLFYRKNVGLKMILEKKMSFKVWISNKGLEHQQARMANENEPTM